MALWMSRGAAGRACLNYYFCMWGRWAGKEARVRRAVHVRYTTALKRGFTLVLRGIQFSNFLLKKIGCNIVLV